MSKVTLEELKSLIWYCPLTGQFLNLKTRGRGKVKAGTFNTNYNKNGYLLITINKQVYYGHVLAWFYMTGEWPKDQIDHKDLATSNNRWDNLRQATKAENGRNRGISKNNTTGYKGISKNKDGFMVRICIGTYKNLEEAAEVYAKAVQIYHGEFARLR